MSAATPDIEGWRDLNSADEERRRVEIDLQAKRQEAEAARAEVRQLQIELEKERAETAAAMRHYQERLEKAKREATRLEIQLAKAQIQGSDGHGSEAKLVKLKVEEKTNAILQAMQEMREHQQKCFQQVKSLASVMLQACSHPTPGATPLAGSDAGRASSSMVNGNGSVPLPQPSSAPSVISSATRARLFHSSSPAAASASASGPTRDDGGTGTQAWFQAMKANLESFGDVEVFAEEAQQECMSCLQNIDAAYRVRPRKCSHIFHVECLLHWWTEGTCPVCGASFAPEASARPRSPPPLTRGRHASSEASSGRV